MKEYRYYLRNSENKPIITVVLLKSGNSVARGTSICSLLDNPCKKTGYNIAKGRAIKAMKHGTDCEPIAREEAYKTIHSAYYPLGKVLPIVYQRIWPVKKCEIDPPLMPFEKEMIEAVKE